MGQWQTLSERGRCKRRDSVWRLLFGTLLLSVASAKSVADLLDVRSIDGNGNNTLRPLAGSANNASYVLATTPSIRLTGRAKQ